MTEYVFDFDRFEEPDLTTGMREAVTRCGDCKYFRACDLRVVLGRDKYYCARLDGVGNVEVGPEGFCAWGEGLDE